MNANQFYHICRSAGSIANLRSITVIGAAAVTPWIAKSGKQASWTSLELDLVLPDHEISDLVDGTIGELSIFHSTFGIYGHGLTIDSFIAPKDWQSRKGVFPEPISGLEIIVPSVADLIISKFARGDDKDIDFAVFCYKEFYLNHETINDLIFSNENSFGRYFESIKRSYEVFLGRVDQFTV